MNNGWIDMSKKDDGYETVAVIESTNEKGALVVLFWLWGLAGFLICALLIFAMLGDVGVGTSADVTAMLLFWIGGMIFFGLGALLPRNRSNFRKPKA